MSPKEQSYISQRVPVPPEFEEVFSHFYIAANPTHEAIRKTLLPSYQTIMVFSFGTPAFITSNKQTTIPVEKCMVLGPVKQPIDYTLPVGADLLVANFKSDAFYRFFGQAIVSGQLPIHPDDLLEENCFTRLWQVLQPMTTSTERVQFILGFCRPYLKSRDTIVERIEDLKGTDTSINPVKAIAGETQQSERSIQLKHKKYFGYSVKEITRYQRFQKAIEMVQDNVTHAKKTDWFDVISECGYYDQSQLIHDFKHYLDLSPTRFLQFQQDICIAAPEQ